MSLHTNPEAGAHNLLVNCVGLKEGQSILFVCDEEGKSHYDMDVSKFISEIALETGAEVSKVYVSPSIGSENFPESVSEAMQAVDHTVFFSQLGDRIRFCDTPGNSTKTMTYTLDMAMLGSPFATVHHGLMQDVTEMLRKKWSEGGTWQITCPLGTRLRGTLEANSVDPKGENNFTVRLFPLGILPPIGASTMTGVAASKWLLPTQNRYYEPDSLLADLPVLIRIDEGRIKSFTGHRSDAFRSHYDHVASLFDIDPGFIHSWHSGHHPKTSYSGAISENAARWISVAFNSPRYTHIHSCGEYPPGEIGIGIVDATIEFNGEKLWQDGEFVFLNRPEVRDLLNTYPGHDDAFEMSWNLGL